MTNIEKTNQNITQELNAPFPYEEYGVNYEGNVYISQQSVVDRLNHVIGFSNWELTPQEINVDMEQYSVSVLGMLKVYVSEQDRWINRTQFGNDTMTIKKGADVPDAQAIEDAKKSSMSDALKKCASWFGVASDVYKSKIKAVKKGNKVWHNLVKNHNLNEYDVQKGIVILPDSYKDYYEEKGWEGIFESDKIAAIKGSSNSKGQAQNGRKQNSQGNGKAQKPDNFRLKVLSKPKMNQDQTCIFDALTEKSEEIVVLVPKVKAQLAVNVVKPDKVIYITGWYNDKNGVLKMANNANIQVENQTNAS